MIQQLIILQFILQLQQHRLFQQILQYQLILLLKKIPQLKLLKQLNRLQHFQVHFLQLVVIQKRNQILQMCFCI